MENNVRFGELVADSFNRTRVPGEQGVWPQ